MRIAKLLVAVAVIGVLVVGGCATIKPTEPTKAVAALSEGNKLEAEAESTEAAVDRAAKFKAAIGKYDTAAAAEGKTAAMAVVAARALFAKGKVLAGVPASDVPAQGPGARLNQKFTTKAQDLSAARETFRQLAQRFKGDLPPRDRLDELQADFGRTDGRIINDVVQRANAYYRLVGRRMDETNRGNVLYKMIDALVALTGRKPAFSYWFAIILLTVIVKILITPLTKAQFKSMKEMQRLQPLVKELQEKYKNNKQELCVKTMALYKEHGVNPLAGCLPLLIQMPILIVVYTAIRYYEIRFATGTFLWIGFGPVVHKFSIPLMGRPVWVTAADLSQPDLILLVLYTISMIVSQRLTIVDPTQAEQQRLMSIMMPVMFFLIIGYLPSAFMLYWLTFNILQTWQQYHVIHGGRAAVQPAEVTPPAPRPPRARPSARRRRRR